MSSFTFSSEHSDLFSYSIFVLESDTEVPEALKAFVRLLLLSGNEFTKARDKGKLPKPKIDGQILTIMIDVLTNRLSQYPTSIQVWSLNYTPYMLPLHVC